MTHSYLLTIFDDVTGVDAFVDARLAELVVVAILVDKTF